MKGFISSRVTNITCDILVPRGRVPFGQHQESRSLAKSNTGSPRFTDFPSLCACSESSLTNLIGSGLNLLCLLSHSKTECRWTRPEVAILGADQKERGLWGRECTCDGSIAKPEHAQCSHFRSMAEVSFLPSENTRKRASASRELNHLLGLPNRVSSRYFQERSNTVISS